MTYFLNSPINSIVLISNDSLLVMESEILEVKEAVANKEMTKKDGKQSIILSRNDQLFKSGMFFLANLIEPKVHPKQTIIMLLTSELDGVVIAHRNIWEAKL